MMAKGFTDNQLVQMQLKITRDYKNLANQSD